MIGLVTHAGGTVLPILAQAGARRNELAGIHAGQLRVRVTQPPEQGKANRAIAELLCRSLHLKRSQIELLHGQSSPRKQFLILGLTPAELHARITAVAGGAKP